MINPLFLLIPAVGVGGTAVVLRQRAKAKAAAANAGGIPPQTPAQAAAQAAANAAIRAAGVPALPPNPKQPDGTVSPQALSISLQAEKARAGQLTDAQLAVIEANAVPGVNCAVFDPNAGGGTPMPDGTFKAGDIIPTDHVTISVSAAGLQGLGVAGDVLIRETQFNTPTEVIGVIIDPRINDNGVVRNFPLTAVTGVGPVSF